MPPYFFKLKTMMVEVTVRYNKKKKLEDLTEEDQALIESKKILEEDYNFENDKEFMSFTYDKVVFNFKDIAEIMRLDNDHVQVNKYNNTTWIIQIQWDTFLALYTQITGLVINKVEY